MEEKGFFRRRYESWKQSNAELARDMANKKLEELQSTQEWQTIYGELSSVNDFLSATELVGKCQEQIGDNYNLVKCLESIDWMYSVGFIVKKFEFKFEDGTNKSLVVGVDEVQYPEVGYDVDLDRMLEELGFSIKKRGWSENLSIKYALNHRYGNGGETSPFDPSIFA